MTYRKSVARAGAAIAIAAAMATTASAEIQSVELNVLGSVSFLSSYENYEEAFWNDRLREASGGKIRATARGFDEMGLKGGEILRLTGLDKLLATEVSLLSHGQKQSLELAMVVSLEPRLILLDEPTAGLTKAERTTIGTILKKLTSELGFAAILVEHDLDFVCDISSRIVVLHQGRLVLDGSVQEVVNSDIVKTIYSGGEHV